VCNLDWLQLPCAAARESGNVHFTGLFSRTAASTLIESKRAPFRPEPRTKTVQNVAVAAKPTPAKSVEGRQHPVTTDPTLKKATTTIGGKTEDLSDQSSEISDPVLKKAKITIAGKMENPASAEFVDMRRATRKNTFGQPIDTICGHVKGKKHLARTRESSRSCISSRTMRLTSLMLTPRTQWRRPRIATYAPARMRNEL
jgi:hypothetical protein